MTYTNYNKLWERESEFGNIVSEKDEKKQRISINQLKLPAHDFYKKMKK